MKFVILQKYTFPLDTCEAKSKITIGQTVTGFYFSNIFLILSF